MVSANYASVNGGEANKASARNAAIQPNGCNKTVVDEAEATWDANVSFAQGTTNAFGISVIGLAGRNGGRALAQQRAAVGWAAPGHAFVYG